MYHINKIFALAIIVLLTGCSIGGEKKIKIFSIEKPREKLDYPMPTALQLEELKWIIITSENAQEVFAKLEAAGIDPVLFGLTDKDYQVLARNFAQIRQKLQETNNLLKEYQKYYEETDNSK
jgi:tRNA nucleotidyltransferase/poly(A) polymerase